MYRNKFQPIIKATGRRLTVLLLASLTVFVSGATVIAQQQSATQPQSPDPADFSLADGFSADLVFQVPKEFGSWVSMTTTPDGLIASDQYGKLYRIHPGEVTAKTKVDPLNLEIGFAQGLLWAFDSLYVVAHGNKKRKAGLYRLQDTNNDGKLDSVRLLREIQGGGEHGPHAVILSPDKKSLYVCAGNHTKLPTVQSSQVPQNWQEDNLLKRIWDPGGHAVGIMAPGGWICKTDPEGKDFELISMGFRNQYDIAFDANGELFTYDADMEWDIGTPWYRPTRVCHVTSGSEFGWRGGDAKWPSYYPDSRPAVIDIGPGSPTGVTFGTGAHYPEKYQRALFIADWSFGFIYAVHMKADGGTWTAEKELFCSAPALQVTDMVVHEGDLYFAIGGRRTQSALYRISAVDSEVKAAAPLEMTEAQKVRRSIERREFNDAPKMDSLWANLNHSDRAVRYAARVAIEAEPFDTWSARVDSEARPQALLEALLAMTRCAPASAGAGDQVVQAIRDNLKWDQLTEMQKLHQLRVMGLAVIRLQSENGEDKFPSEIAQMCEPLFPSDSVYINRELCRLLVAVGSNQIVAKTLKLLGDAPTQEEQIDYVLSLRMAKAGWTPELRKQYLQWFVDSAIFQGGKSFSGYLKTARQEFIETLSTEQKTSLASLIETPMKERDPYSELKARKVVKQWTVDELKTVLDSADMSKRDLERGKQVFATAQCYKCHQFQGSGGIVGPDLTGLSRRYTDHYILETLIDPSKEISDQYQATVFQLVDGKMITGRVANLSGDRYMVQEDMIVPGRLTNINRSDIEDSRPSRTSPMPANLLDTFTEEEILDLMAYLRSAK